MKKNKDNRHGGSGNDSGQPVSEKLDQARRDQAVGIKANIVTELRNRELKSRLRIL